MDRWPNGGGEAVMARLVRPPLTPFSRLFGQAVSVSLRSPLLAVGLGGAVLLSRAGWATSLLLIGQGLFGQSALPLLAALGLGLAASLFGAVVELAIWAGGIPLLAERLRGGTRPWWRIFAGGLEAVFATLLGIGALRVLGWLLFQLAGIGAFFAFIASIAASPALAIFAVPLLLLFVAGDLIARILAWVAIARVGAFEEDLLTALVAGLRQFFGRPMAHLLTWWGANFAISLAGGGVAVLVAAGLGAMPTLGAALLTLGSSLLVGAILLLVMAVYTALSLDAAPQRASR